MVFINFIFHILLDVDDKNFADVYIYKDEHLSEMVESALNTTDVNNDGFIDYLEFRKAKYF